MQLKLAPCISGEPSSEPSFWGSSQAKPSQAQSCPLPSWRSHFLPQASRIKIASPSSRNTCQKVQDDANEHCQAAVAWCLVWVKIHRTEIPSSFTQQEQLTEWQLPSTAKKKKKSTQLWPGGSLPARLRPAQSLGLNSPLHLSSDHCKAPGVLVSCAKCLRSSQKENAHPSSEALPRPHTEGAIRDAVFSPAAFVHLC